MATGTRRNPRPSLPLAVVLYFGGFYDVIFALLGILILVWKGT